MSDDTPRTPSLTLTEAARAAGVSRSTVRRKLDRGELPDAWREDERPYRWRVPVPTLLAAGVDVQAPNRQGASEPEEASSARVAELEQALAVERERRVAAERLAEERAERVEDLRATLRQLEATTGQAQPPPRGLLARLLGG